MRSAERGEGCPLIFCVCGRCLADSGHVGYGDSYGWTGWARRSRVIEISKSGTTVRTWKRLGNDELEMRDEQTLL
jgi:hypothetical protein